MATVEIVRPGSAQAQAQKEKKLFSVTVGKVKDIFYFPLREFDLRMKYFKAALERGEISFFGVGVEE